MGLKVLKNHEKWVIKISKKYRKAGKGIKIDLNSEKPSLKIIKNWFKILQKWFKNNENWREI